MPEKPRKRGKGGPSGQYAFTITITLEEYMTANDIYHFFDDDSPRKVKNPTLEELRKYQKHHMELLKNYGEQVAFMDKMLRDCREERKKFFAEDLPKISKKLTDEHVDDAIRKEWLTRLEKAMEHSFKESDRLVSAFAVQKADEFREAMEEKLKGL